MNCTFEVAVFLKKNY